MPMGPDLTFDNHNDNLEKPRREPVRVEDVYNKDYVFVHADYAYISKEDAPYVALAILEYSGAIPDETVMPWGDDKLGLAGRCLREHVKAEVQKRCEQTRLDAEADTLRRAHGGESAHGTVFDKLPDSEKEKWREVAKAARGLRK